MDFNGVETGSYPYFAALLYDGTYLYGSNTNSGLNGDGTIFKILPDGTGFTKLYDLLDDVTGQSSQSSLISDGTYLYGTAADGGPNNHGTVYRLKKDGTEFTVLYDFPGELTGFYPEGGLYFDGTYLYGGTVNGGVFGGGVLYKIRPDGTEFSIVLDFDCIVSGCSLYGAVVSDGTYFYGMTRGGGTDGLGTVFKIKPDGTDFIKLMDMIDDPNGAWGYASFVLDDGMLYGITNNGGEDNRGTIFKIATDGSNYQKLVDFDNDNGAQPLGSLILVGTTLYGMAELGGDDYLGTLYQLETDGSNFILLHEFDGAETGSLPYGTLVYVNGALFGMTNSGGANEQGVIFRYGEMTESVHNTIIETTSVSPNPNMGQFHITISAVINADAPLNIYNLLGELIYTGDFENGDITLANITPGMYVYEIISDYKYTGSFIVE
ncbi:MAG: T9SS type A sorting domain-containing protein [Bacteroidetes bacterium]|nr:T9SS type A sorting domain-containing protein [Bacteroidota bacterium]